MPNISRSKGNQDKMKYNVRNTFLQKSSSHPENEVPRLVPVLFLFFKKHYIRKNQVVRTIVFTYFGRPPLGHAIQTNFLTFQTVNPEIFSTLIFIKEYGTSFSTTICLWFFKKNIAHVIFYYLKNFIVWLSLLLEILGDMCIAILCCLVCDAINFEINHSFLIKPFFYITKKPRHKNKISQERKQLLTWNKKHFSSPLKGFHWSKQK